MNRSIDEPSADPASVAPAERWGLAGIGVPARIAVIVWLTGLLVSAAAVWPAWAWWAGRLGPTPSGDRMAERFEIGIFIELVGRAPSTPIGMTGAALAAGFVLAVLLNPLLAGGATATLADGRVAGLVPRFFEAGVRFYGRFLRALVYLGVPALAVVALVWESGVQLMSFVGGRGHERLSLVVLASTGVASVTTAAFFTAVLDLARIDLATSGSRDVLAACRLALGLALRRLPALVRIGLQYALLLALLAAATMALRTWLLGTGWGSLGMAVLLQQAFAYGRARLRITVIAAEMTLGSRQAPPHQPAHGTPYPDSVDP